MATFYTVEGRTPLGLDDRYSLEWFEKGEAQEDDAGLLWKEPHWHLFALDLKTQEAIFAKTDNSLEIFQAPFLNHALYQCAVALLAMPFAEFIALSQNVARPRTLVHVLSIGRCGSTLAHHLFNKAEGVVCLSEPETYFPLAMARSEVDDRLAVELIQASSRFHFLVGSFKPFHTLVIKHQSQSLFQADRIRRADPEAKYIFMYRDAESWANSLYRMAQGFGMPLIQDATRKAFSWRMMSAGTDLTYLKGLIDLDDESVQFESISAVAWALQMNEHARLQKAGFRMLNVSYDELNRYRSQTVRKLFTYCDLALDHLETVLSAYDKDSQEGTHIGRATATVGFSDDNIRKFYAVLALCKNAPASNVIL